MKNLLLLTGLLLLSLCASAQSMIEAKRGYKITDYANEEHREELEKKRNDQLLKAFLDSLNQAGKLPKEVLTTIPEEEGKKDTAEVKEVTNVKGLGNYQFNGTRVVPTLTLLASRFKRNPESDWITSVEVFALQNFTDSTAKNDYRKNFFIPEFSSYGINATVGWCFDPARQRNRALRKLQDSGKILPKQDTLNHPVNYQRGFLGVLLSTDFVGKEFKKEYTDATIEDNFATTNVFVNLTAEYVFPESSISVYGGGNFASVLTNREAFKTAFQEKLTSRRDFWYLTVGFRAELDILGKEEDGTSEEGDVGKNTLALDVGFILQSGQVSAFIGNKDPVIPMIRVGFRHSFLSNR